MDGDDFFEWKPLFQQYATFYGHPVPDELSLTIWGWLTDPRQNLFAFVAEQTRTIEVTHEHGDVSTIESAHFVGFIHFCAVTRALHADVQLQIQDHYVEPTVRRMGVAKALIEAVKMGARGRGAANVAWAVSSDNRIGRGMSDRLGRQTEWVVYELDV